MNKQEKPTHCANPDCKKPLTHIEGRRPKKYCTPKCGTLHWQKLNYKGSDKETKYKIVLKEDWDKLRKLDINFQPSTLQSFDGKETDKFKADEVGQTPSSNPPDQVKDKKSESKLQEYERELGTLGDTPIAKQRKKWLNAQIYKLKYPK